MKARKMPSLFPCLILLSAIFLYGSGCSKMERPIIIAHRGSSFTAPENTLAAALLAWEQNADAVEVDVYLTTDKKIVCLHDETTKRTTGVDLEIAESSWDQVKDLDAGSWKSPEYKGEPIPLLTSVIDSIPPGKTLYVEIKAGEEIVPYLTKVIEASGKRDQIIIICFDFDTLKAAHEAMPGIPVMWLFCEKKDQETGKRPPLQISRIERARAAGFDAMDVCYHCVDPGVAAACKARGLGIYIWTVDDPVEAERQFKMGVQGVTTNKPDLMLEHFAR